MGNRNYKIRFENSTPDFQVTAGCAMDAIAIAEEHTGTSREKIYDVEEDDYGQVSNLRGAALDIYLYGAPDDDDEYLDEEGDRT